VEPMTTNEAPQELPAQQVELPFGGRLGMFLLCLGLIVLASVTIGDVVVRLLAWIFGW